MRDKRYNKLPSIAKWARVAFVRVKMTHNDFLKNENKENYKNVKSKFREKKT